MGRLLGVLLLFTGAGLVTRELWRNASDDALDYASILARSRELEELFRSRKQFIEARDIALQSMASGRMTLRQGCAEVRTAADVFYPHYLRFLAEANPPESAELRVAHNLLGHLSSWAKDGVIAAPALPDLQQQLEEWY